MELIRCAFCGKNQGEVPLMILQLKSNTAICSDCSAECMRIVIEQSVPSINGQKDGPRIGKETVTKPTYPVVEAMLDMQKERWVIEITEGRYTFLKEINGSVDENYAPVCKAQAAVFAAAIIQGFQPPRDLRSCDKQPG